MKGSEQCGSEMIHVKAKLVKYDFVISSMLLVVVLVCFFNQTNGHLTVCGTIKAFYHTVYSQSK